MSKCTSTTGPIIWDILPTGCDISVSLAQLAARFYKIAPENIIVISDDITLDVGRIRVRRKGSHGGHNGLKDIIRMLSTENYPRIKLGVGQKPHPDYDVIDWVLGQLPENDLATVKATFPTVLEGLEKMVAGDIDAAMQICNKK